MDTAQRNHTQVSSLDVEGTNVYDRQGNQIGEIDHLMIDKISGRVTYAILSFGGFLGIGNNHYPIPWSALSYDVSVDGFRTNVSEAQLKNAPDYDDDSWQNRDWETRVHTNYDAPPYWSK